MAKASLTLPNGTVVNIEGTPQEVQELLEFYSRLPATRARQKARRRATPVNKAAKTEAPSEAIDYAEIVNLVKDCDEAEAIEEQILHRASQVNRVLLPLYIVYKYLDNAQGLTSGEVSKVTTDLGIRVSQPNASRTLSGTASPYVIGDKVKKKGQPVRYKLSRRGVKYLKAVLEGKESAE
jgi:NADH dehydrogenase/NADH:ubiquinone oxidoreductase subunit G